MSLIDKKIEILIMFSKVVKLKKLKFFIK